MPQWEYDKIDLNDLPCKGSDVDALNDAGHDRWELVSITPNAIAACNVPPRVMSLMSRRTART
jgi:hypothetical protein